MALHFEMHARQGNLFLKRLAEELGHPNDRYRAARTLRAVLHAFRDLLSVDENVELLAQLPMFLKAAYVAGWSLPHRKDEIQSYEDLLERIRLYDAPVANVDFPDEETLEQAVRAVFRTLGRYVSIGEFEDIGSQPHRPVNPLVEQAGIMAVSNA